MTQLSKEWKKGPKENSVEENSVERLMLASNYQFNNVLFYNYQ